MRKTPLSVLLLVLIVTSGCEINDGVLSRRINVMDYLQTKYDIYNDLESVSDSDDICDIQINTPNDDITVTYAANDRSADAEAFQRQQQIEAGQLDQDPQPEPQQSSSSSSYSSSLFNDGEAPVVESNPSATTSSAFGSSQDNAQIYGVEENPLYRLTVTQIQPSEFTNIRISHPTARTATLEAPGWAQVVMKSSATSSSSVRYDSVAINVKYYINQSPQGRWLCTERSVDIIDASILSRREQSQATSARPQVVW